jgi:hypothetical protein
MENNDIIHGLYDENIWRRIRITSWRDRPYYPTDTINESSTDNIDTINSSTSSNQTNDQ